MGELTHRMRRIHLEGNKNRRGESKEKSFPLSPGRDQHKGLPDPDSYFFLSKQAQYFHSVKV